MKKVLLVNPDLGWDLERPHYERAATLPYVGAKAFMTPLAVATVAAMTPDDIEVDLWDEPVHGLIDDSTEFKKDYDLVGITGHVSHLPRAKRIAQVFRKRGILVAIGGIGVSAIPEVCRGAFDILFIGEAELTWPRFIADWKAGNYRTEYRQVTKPDLDISPAPRWDSLTDSMKSYVMGAVQTTRGCPFSCDFCAVTHLYGRRARQKPIDRVLEEVSVLERLGMQRINVCDDNFIGNPRYTKDLLRELVSLNRSFRKVIRFSTQLSINVAKDDELLELLADANFGVVSIGVETPNKESLLETSKLQNYETDLIQDVKKIQSYGIAVRGATVVGLDHDDTTIFDQQFEFLQEACITVLSTHMCRAVPGTGLWARFRKEGRVILDEDYQISGRYQGSDTNVIPKRMTRLELFSGYLNMVERLSDWRNFEARVKGFVSGVKRTPDIPHKKKAVRRGALFGLLKYVFFSLDKEGRRASFRILRYTRENAPFMIGTVLSILSRQYSRLAMLQGVCEELRERIELEESGDFKPDMDPGDALIPEGFEEYYREIFPDIHQRVHQGLTDKTRTDELLIEMFVDLIKRWGMGKIPHTPGREKLERFSDQHKVFLYELADRAVEKENSATTSVHGENPPYPWKNGENPSYPWKKRELHAPELVQEDEGLPDIRGIHLADDVLKAVEQELRPIVIPGKQSGEVLVSH